MPEAEKAFRLKAPLQTAWSFLNDLKKIATCIPGCEEVDVIDDAHSVWKIRVEAGMFSRVVEMNAHVDERVFPSHVRFAFESEAWGFKGGGALDLRPVSEGETEVTYRLSLNATGFLASSLNYVFAHRVDEQAERFVECVRGRIE